VRGALEVVWELGAFVSDRLLKLCLSKSFDFLVGSPETSSFEARSIEVSYSKVRILEFGSLHIGFPEAGLLEVS
jgi:hypothetical protein